MKPVIKAFALLLVVVLFAGTGLAVYVITGGVSAREQPGAVETFIARNIRKIAIARRARGLRNPVPLTAESVAGGRGHFADHCAVCHGNDGSGATEMGRGLWPKAQDMRREETQNLSDGELFYIIENGIRLTGMPAWGTGTREGEEASWRLVHFIRHLPTISPEEVAEMERLNPKPPEEWREQAEIQKFLEGGEQHPESAPSAHEHR